MFNCIKARATFWACSYILTNGARNGFLRNESTHSGVGLNYYSLSDTTQVPSHKSGGLSIVHKSREVGRFSRDIYLNDVAWIILFIPRHLIRGSLPKEYFPTRYWVTCYSSWRKLKIKINSLFTIGPCDLTQPNYKVWKSRWFRKASRNKSFTYTEDHLWCGTHRFPE